jgi:hypothetical protein
VLLLRLRLTASPDLKPPRSGDDGKRLRDLRRSPKVEPQPEPRSVFQFQRGAVAADCWRELMPTGRVEGRALA